MPDMPNWISKGPSLKRLDERSLDLGTLQAIRADLQGGTDIPTIAKTRIGITEAEREHLRVDWFDEATRWWRPQTGNGGISNPEPIIRRGLMEAIDIALNPTSSGLRVDGTGSTSPLQQLPSGHLPLDCYWVCQRGEVRQASVGIAWSPRQVTVMIYTPHGPAATVAALGPANLTVAEPIRIVQMTEAGPAVVDPKHRPSQ